MHLQVHQLLSVLFLCYLVVLPVFSCTLLFYSVSTTIFPTIYTWITTQAQLNYATIKNLFKVTLSTYSIFAT